MRVSEFDKKIGHRIRELRIKHGYNQAYIGELLEVTFQQIQKYETGSNRIPIKALYVLKNVYNIEFDDFFITIANDVPLPEINHRPYHMINDIFYLIKSKRAQTTLYRLAELMVYLESNGKYELTETV